MDTQNAFDANTGEYIRIKALLPNDDMSLRDLTAINATTSTTIDIFGLARKEKQTQAQICGLNQPPLVLVDDIKNDGRDTKQLKNTLGLDVEDNGDIHYQRQHCANQRISPTMVT